MANPTENVPSGNIVPGEGHVQDAHVGWKSASGQTVFNLDLNTSSARSDKVSEGNNVFVVSGKHEPDNDIKHNSITIEGHGSNNVIVLPGHQADYQTEATPQPKEISGSYKLGDIILERTNKDGHVTSIALRGNIDAIAFAAENSIAPDSSPNEVAKLVASGSVTTHPVKELFNEAWAKMDPMQQCQAKAVAADIPDILKQFRTAPHTDASMDTVNSQILTKLAATCSKER